MKVQLLAFGIAKDILKSSKMDFELDDELSVADFKRQLGAQYPEFNKLISLKFAVNTEYVTNDYIIQDNDEVVIIPPVSGG